MGTLLTLGMLSGTLKRRVFVESRKSMTDQEREEILKGAGAFLEKYLPSNMLYSLFVVEEQGSPVFCVSTIDLSDLTAYLIDTLNENKIREIARRPVRSEGQEPRFKREA